MERNRCVDLLRVGAIAIVALGHWLLVDITYRQGRLSGLNALLSIGWGRWLTLPLQVMPVFFVVGGYANAVSWTAHRQRGEGWTDWVRGRVTRLSWPTTVYAAVVTLAVTASRLLGADPAVVARAGWLLALHLWFLPVYLLLIALTPLLLALHRRWGAVVPAAMAAGAAMVDVAVLGLHLPLVGFANYLLVWGTMHQWGFAWQDGTLTRSRPRCGALAAAGAVALTALLALGPFPVDMIGAGMRVGNTSPPSIALLALAAAQTGLLLLAEPALRGLLEPPGRWRSLSRLNRAVMTVYLWHMVPVVVVAVTLYPAGIMPQPPVGSALWWALRPVWIVLLAAVLVPLTIAVTRAQRPLRLLPSGLGPSGRWSPVLMAGGLGALASALAVLAAGGLAPAGHPPLPVFGVYVCGVVLVLLSGAPGGAGRSPRPAVAPAPGLTRRRRGDRRPVARDRRPYRRRLPAPGGSRTPSSS